jgi:Domain of unknown function (DUF4279)
MKPDEPQLIVALYVRGDALDPELVTQLLGVEPTKMQKKGQEFVTPSGREFATKIGLWSLVIQSESTSLDEHLTMLLSALAGRKGIDSIPGVEDAYVDVFVALASDKDGDANCALSVGPAALEGLATLGLPLRISMTAGPE